MTIHVLACLDNCGWLSLLKVMTHLLLDVNVAQNVRTAHMTVHFYACVLRKSHEYSFGCWIRVSSWNVRQRSLYAHSISI